jgi:protein SCO1/2
MNSRKVFWFVGIGIVAALVGALAARSLVQSSAVAQLQSGTRLNPPKPLPDFMLLDQDARPIGNEQLLGTWSLVFFGFTNCGDICPTTLALLAQVRRALTDLPPAKLPQLVFISVDSRRDTPEIVKKYVKNFDPTFIGVSGPQEKIDMLTKALGIPSAVRKLDNDTYAVEHSAAILAIDPKGRLAALFTPPYTIDGLALDYRVLAGTTK